MKDELVRALDPESRLSVVLADCLTAAGELARAHLSGPAAATYLARAMAGAALLGAEMSQKEETVTFRVEAPGPLGGFLLESTAAGTLRGYTKKKILDAFDGGTFTDTDVLGETGTVEVIRSIPGAILSSGQAAFRVDRLAAKNPGYVAVALNAYLTQSLQRRVVSVLAGAAGDDGVPTLARGVLVECPPDGDGAAFVRMAERIAAGTVAKALGGALLSPRTFLKKLGLERAVLRGSSPLSFACRCSADRAAQMLAALSEEERRALPPRVDVTCHMCGRTWTVETR